MCLIWVLFFFFFSFCYYACFDLFFLSFCFLSFLCSVHLLRSGENNSRLDTYTYIKDADQEDEVLQATSSCITPNLPFPISITSVKLYLTQINLTKKKKKGHEMRVPFPTTRVAAAMTRVGNAVGDELFPILVWLTVFGVTRVAPSLILRLSIAVPQSMDVPPLLRWRRTSTSTGLSADELSARLADLINNTPSGSSSSNNGSSATASLLDASAWTRASRRLSENLVSILTYPQRLLTYVLFQHSQRLALQASATTPHSRPVVVRLLLRLVTSFTANWVHASGNMLYDTVVTYLSTRLGSWSAGGTAGFVMGNGGPGANASSTRLGSGWRDLLFASCVSTSINFLLQTIWLETMTSAGELRAFGRTQDNGASTAASGDDPITSFTHVVLSTLARLGSKDTLYRLGRMALQPQQPQQPSPYSSPRTSSSFSSTPAPLPPTSATATRAAASVASRVYLCGGNSFVFALSGFRFTFYGDVQQLTTSAANCMTDALDLLLRQANQRVAAQRYLSDFSSSASSSDITDGVGSGHVWRPPASLQSARLAASSDVVLSPASSMQLLPIYLVNFAVGAGVGLMWREQRVLLTAGRKVPLVRSVLAVLSPLPPPPLKLPDALQELSPECHILLIDASGHVEVVAEDHTAPIVKREEGSADDPLALHAPASTPTATAPTRARLVVPQDLFCPIKRTLMCDPVQTVDGFTYDRDGIEEWLRVHDTAPLTNLHLDSVAVRVNWGARRQVEALIAQFVAAVGTP